MVQYKTGNLLETNVDYICQQVNCQGRMASGIAKQNNYGYDGKRYTSYDAFWECLNRIAQTCPKGSKIGFPYRIGCCLGGANWPVIETMIYMVLGKDFDVYIYCLEDEKHD